MPAIGGASEKKVRGVAAGDEQNEADCREEKQHQRANGTEDVLRKGLDHAGPAVGEWAVMQRMEARHDCAQLRLRLFGRDAWPETGECVGTRLIAVGPLLRGEGGGGPY